MCTLVTTQWTAIDGRQKEIQSTHSPYDSLSYRDCVDSLRSMTSPSRQEAEVITSLLCVVGVSYIGVGDRVSSSANRRLTY